MKTVNIPTQAKTVTSLLKKAQKGGLILRSPKGQEFILAEDILCHSRILFMISFPLYMIIKSSKLDGLMGNIICVYKKVEDRD